MSLSALASSPPEKASCTPKDFKQSGYVYKKARAEDDAALRHILRTTPMEGWVKLTFEREPDFFKACQLMGKTTAVIASKENNTKDLVGMYTFTELPVHINGSAAKIGYLGSLRVLPEKRHRIRALKGGFASINVLTCAEHLQSYWFTSIAADNDPARRMLEAGIKDLPVYKHISDVETLLFSTRQGKPCGLLQSAIGADIPAIVNFYNSHAAQYQFAPVLTEDWLTGLLDDNTVRLEDLLLLKNHGKICACMALWDQRRIRQTVVQGYKAPLGLLRVMYNAFARLSRRVMLPPAGEKVEQVFLAFFAVDSSMHSLVPDILCDALYKVGQRNADAASLGLSTSNPLLPLLCSAMPATKYRTCIEAVAWQAEDFTSLDFQRPAQPEIALL